MAVLEFPKTYISKNGEEKALPQPSRPISESVRTNNLVQTFESGHEQRRQKGDPRRTFEFTYNVLLEEEAKCITSFFISCYGNVKTFFWVHPVTKEYLQVRFDMDALLKENFSHGPKGPLYKLNIKLIQVF